LIDDFENGKLWNLKRHPLFNKFHKKQIFAYLVCFKLIT